MADSTSIPIIVQGNSFSLAIPLQIYVISEGEMVLQDYTPDPTDTISIQLKGSRRNYTYTPTTDGNVCNINLSGYELADNYAIMVSIVKENGQRLRSFRTDQFFIVESSDDLTQDDIIEGLEENVIYLNAQAFVAGADGRGIESIVKTATAGLVDTYTITYTDGTTSTFEVTNGAQGQQGADCVGISTIAKTSTSGLVDTYTITLSNGETSTFEVTNGRDGVDLGLANIVDNLTEGGSTNVLSAEQGKILGQRTEYPMEKVSPSESGTVKDTNGSDWDVSGYWRTPYTIIDPTKPVYAVGDSNNNSVAFVAFYNNKKQFISCVKKLGAAGVEYEIQVPEGATLARSTCTTAQKPTAYLTQKVQHNLVDVVSQNREDIEGEINLLDGVTLYLGYLVNGVVTGATYSTSDYIRIDDTETLIFEVVGSQYISGVDVLAFYSDRDDSTYLGGITTSSSGNFAYKDVLTIPNGAKWVRVCGPYVAERMSLMCAKNEFNEVVLESIIKTPSVIAPLQIAKFLLPSFMDVVVGRQCDFFVGDTIDNPSSLPFRYTYGADITDLGKGHLRITGASVGTTDLVLTTKISADAKTFLYNDGSVGSQTIKVRKVAKSGGSGTFNVLIVGDSLVEYGPNPSETYRLLNEDGDVTINQIGKQSQSLDGVTYHHEGHGGWTWARFNSGSDSPFVFNGQLSFAQYMATYFPTLSGIDFCVVMLGTNDAESVVLSGAKTFVDALLADYPNCKIAIGIPAYGRPCDGMPLAMERKLRYEAYVYLNTFDNGKYHANVTCIGQGCWIDRVNDYQHEEADSTPYSEDKFIRYTDGVHPRTQGYKQWGRAVYCKIRSWFAGNL